MGRITTLLKAWKEQADTGARDALFALLHTELQAIAARELRRMYRFDHKVQPAELVSELYLRLANSDATWDNRRFFFGMVRDVVRSVLLDMARRDGAGKRPPSDMRVQTNAALRLGRNDGAFEVADFYHRLERLRRLNPRHADVLEFHGVLGCSLGDVAEHLGVSLATVKRDLQAARAWWRVDEPPGPGHLSRASSGARR